PSRIAFAAVARSLPVVRVPRLRREARAAIRSARWKRGPGRPTPRGGMRGKHVTLPIAAAAATLFTTIPTDAGADRPNTPPGQEPPTLAREPSISGTATVERSGPDHGRPLVCDEQCVQCVNPGEPAAGGGQRDDVAEARDLVFDAVVGTRVVERARGRDGTGDHAIRQRDDQLSELRRADDAGAHP